MISQYRRMVSLIVPLVLAFAGPMVSRARAELWLGTAVNYAVLVEPDARHVQISNSSLTGNIGIGASTFGNPHGTILQNSSDRITGNVHFASSSGTVQHLITGSVDHNVAAVTAALNTVNALARELAAEATKGTLVSINIGRNGDKVINASSGFLDATGNRVFTVDSRGFDLKSNSDTHGLTINGTASDHVVIDFSTMKNIDGGIFLTGGLTPDHVLFNYTGGGNFNPSSNHHTVSGDFLAVDAKVTWNEVTIHGRLFGGAGGQDFQINSGSILEGSSILAPEPSTAVVALTSLLALACTAGVRRIRHRSSGPPAR